MEQHAQATYNLLEAWIANDDDGAVDRIIATEVVPVASDVFNDLVDVAGTLVRKVAALAKQEPRDVVSGMWLNDAAEVDDEEKQLVRSLITASVYGDSEAFDALQEPVLETDVSALIGRLTDFCAGLIGVLGGLSGQSVARAMEGVRDGLARLELDRGHQRFRASARASTPANPAHWSDLGARKLAGQRTQDT